MSPKSRNRPRPTSRQRSRLAQRLAQRKRRLHPGVAHPVTRVCRWMSVIQPSWWLTPRYKRKARQQWTQQVPLSPAPVAIPATPPAE